jgi:hypothetical protein
MPGHEISDHVFGAVRAKADGSAQARHALHPVEQCNKSHGMPSSILDVAVYAVGGEKLLHDRAHDLPEALALLEHLGTRR